MEYATNGAANRNKFTHLFDCHSNSDQPTLTHLHKQPIGKFSQSN